MIIRSAVDFYQKEFSRFKIMTGAVAASNTYHGSTGQMIGLSEQPRLPPGGQL